MGIFNFVAAAGAKLFGGKKPSEVPNLGALIRDHVRKVGLPDKHVHYWLEGETLVAAGWVGDKSVKEKIILAVGNVEGVDKVEDRLVVGTPPTALQAPKPAPVATAAAPVLAEAPIPVEALPSKAEAEKEVWESRTHVVEKGDTLSKIAKAVYGNANKYMVIFEANKPMLSDPDKIYPGQTLRIPPLDK
jgi:nucleoid-associated protein YgaU